MALNYVTLTIDLFDGAGSHANGGIATFTPSVQLTDATDHEIITQAPVTAAFKPTGSPAVLLLATDNGNVAPSGWAWTVTFTGVPGNPASFSFFLPFSGGSSQNLSAISPVSTAVTQFPANPMTTLGDMIYGGSSPAGVPQRVPGNTSATREFLRQTGSGSSSAAPSWGPIQQSDLGAAGTGPVTSAYAPLLYGAVWGRKYQFYADSYGALGNGVAVTDMVMTTGAPTTLACTSSSPFTSGDVGKAIMVSTATGTYSHLRAAISSFTDSAHVTLSASATANTGGTPGAIGWYGSDDTPALQSWINAMDTYGRAHGYVEGILDPTAMYIADGAFQIGTVSNPGNYQIALPNVPQTSLAYQMAILGSEGAAPFINWLQLVPEVSGAVIASTRLDGTNDGTNGPATVIGGPYAGYGSEDGSKPWSSFQPLIRGLGILNPYNSTQSGLDLWAITGADVNAYRGLIGAVVPSSSAPAPTMTNAAHITNQWTYGLRLPQAGNVDTVRADSIRVEGYSYGYSPSEHSVTVESRTMYCVIGLAPYSGNAFATGHRVTVLKHTSENCANALGYGGSGTAIHVDVHCLDYEAISGNPIYDPSGHLQGYVGFAPLNGSASYISNLTGGGGSTPGANLRCINLSITPGMLTLPGSGPGAPPSSTSAYLNGWYRDLEVTLSVSGGTISAVVADATSELVPASCTWYRFTLPSGHSFTPTFTGTLTMTAKAI